MDMLLLQPTLKSPPPAEILRYIDTFLDQNNTQLRKLNSDSCSTFGEINLQSDDENILECLLAKVDCDSITKFSWKYMNDSNIDILMMLPNLTDIDISWSHEITDNGVKKLYHMTKLKRLDLSYCINLTSEGLKFLKGMQYLENVDLVHCIQLRDLDFLPPYVGTVPTIQYNTKFCYGLDKQKYKYDRMKFIYMTDNGYVDESDSGDEEGVWVINNYAEHNQMVKKLSIYEMHAHIEAYNKMEDFWIEDSLCYTYLYFQTENEETALVNGVMTHETMYKNGGLVFQVPLFSWKIKISNDGNTSNLNENTQRTIIVENIDTRNKLAKKILRYKITGLGPINLGAVSKIVANTEEINKLKLRLKHIDFDSIQPSVLNQGYDPHFYKVLVTKRGLD